MSEWVTLLGEDRPSPTPIDAKARPLAGAAPSGGRKAGALIDSFGRRVRYLRLSTTDRCDFRCVYCMPEAMVFSPRRDLLTLEELGRLSEAFIARGVTKIRLTGGEPLVRRDAMTLFHRLGSHLGYGLDELTLTTNGSQLSKYADGLYAAGVRRVNVSLDSLRPDRFARIARRGRLEDVLAGIDAAAAAGLAIKINAVAMRGVNDDELPELIRWAHGRGFDATLIETMPMGEAQGGGADVHLGLDDVRRRLSAFWTLTDIPDVTGGPARYVRIAQTGGRLGLITPLSRNFCSGCNRVRVSCTGVLYLCLGQEASVDLRAPLRMSADDDLLHAALDRGLAIKPLGHEFVVSPSGSPRNPSRSMSATGG